MKFKKDGNEFEDIEAARSVYCHNKIHCDGCELGKEASKPINACYYMAHAAPKQAARLMGYEVVEEQTCDTCVHNPPSSGDGKPCSMCDTGDQMLNCYQKKEANMDKQKVPPKMLTTEDCRRKIEGELKGLTASCRICPRWSGSDCINIAGEPCLEHLKLAEALLKNKVEDVKEYCETNKSNPWGFWVNVWGAALDAVRNEIKRQNGKPGIS